MKRSLLSLCFLTMASISLCFAGFNDSVSPVPEPGSILLLGTAAAGIGYAAWRGSRKK